MNVEQSLIVADAPLPAVIEAESLKTQALQRCALVGVVKNPEHQKNAVEVLRDVKALLSSIEKARVKTKEKPLELCRQIDKAAKDFSDALKAEELRINTAVGNYQQAELEKARQAEIQRQAELRRIEEERIAELTRIETEKRRQEEARQAESKRIADEQAARESAAAKLASEAKNKTQREAAEKARKEAEEKAKIATAEQARIESERKAADEAAAVERRRQDELALQKAEAVGPQVGTVKAQGQTVKEEFDFEVKDIWLLARMHPGFVRIEENRSEIMAAIKAGVREIKGLRIFPIVKTGVRGKGTVIDIN